MKFSSTTISKVIEPFLAANYPNVQRHLRTQTIVTLFPQCVSNVAWNFTLMSGFLYPHCKAQITTATRRKA